MNQFFCNGILLSDASYHRYFDYKIKSGWYDPSIDWVIIFNKGVEQVRRYTNHDPEIVTIYDYSSDGLLKHVFYADTIISGDNRENILSEARMRNIGDDQYENCVVMK